MHTLLAQYGNLEGAADWEKIPDIPLCMPALAAWMARRGDHELVVFDDDRLTYADADGQYVMSGSGTTGIRIVDGCRETVGRTLILYKTSDRVIVDGNEEARTRTKSGSGAACSPAPAR